MVLKLSKTSDLNSLVLHIRFLGLRVWGPKPSTLTHSRFKKIRIPNKQPLTTETPSKEETTGLRQALAN